MLKTVYLDMDGVLVDWVGGVFDLFGCGPHGQERIRQHDDVYTELSRQLDRKVTDAEVIHKVSLFSPDFWANLKWTKLGPDILRTCARAPSTMILTSPGSHSTQCAAGKTEWVRNNIPTLVGKTAILRDKWEVAHGKSILIDDKQSTIEKFEKAGGYGFLWPRPWNRYRRPPTDQDVRRLGASLDSLIHA